MSECDPCEYRRAAIEAAAQEQEKTSKLRAKWEETESVLASTKRASWMLPAFDPSRPVHETLDYLLRAIRMLAELVTKHDEKERDWRETYKNIMELVGETSKLRDKLVPLHDENARLKIEVYDLKMQLSRAQGEHRR